jgi:hypothetical protein
MAWSTIVGRVVSGHGVASGKADDPRFPVGTLSMQQPFFLERGLDVSRFHGGTLNVSIKPRRYHIIKSAFTFRKVKWTPDLPAEDFSFFDCRIGKPDCGKFVDALIYYPHPETKPEFFQDSSTLEIVAPFIDDIDVQTSLLLHYKNNQIMIPFKKR